jgi:hypothetical protein
MLIQNASKDRRDAPAKTERMKASLVLLFVAVFIFVVDWVAFALGFPIAYSGNYFFLAFVGLLLAIISVYLKLIELGQKKV